MRMTIFVILLLGLIGGCSKSPSRPTGIASWDEVRALADGFVLKGNSDAVLAHTEWAGVPPKAMEYIKPALRDWHGISENFRHTGTQVMTLAEYRAFELEYNKELPEDMRQALLANTKWNVEPEKVIVYTYVSKDPTDPTKAIGRFSAGAFQKNGQWFFAVSYNE